jgi:hypothetical protein
VKGKDKIHGEHQRQNLMERGNFRDQGTDGRIILKSVLNNDVLSPERQNSRRASGAESHGKR